MSKQFLPLTDSLIQMVNIHLYRRKHMGQIVHARLHCTTHHNIRTSIFAFLHTKHMITRHKE